MRTLLLLAFTGASVLGLAADYKFTPQTDTAMMQISLARNKKAKEFRMPAWIPGDYQIFDYGKTIDNVEFTLKGDAVSATQDEKDPNLWRIPSGADSVTYRIKPSRGNFSPNLQIRGEQVFICGGVYGWFEGFQDEPHTLKLNLAGGQESYSALKGAAGSFEAPNLDVLIDSPTIMAPKGTIRIAERQVRGKPHRVLAYGSPQNTDVDGLLRISCAAAEQGYQIFGELPYDRYTFFFDIGGPGGGLEHMDSTRIGLSRNASAQGSTGIIFHEYMHAFNVKRIRAKTLGPFDYTKPAITGTLWWLEGVTDYYADLMATRAGLYQRMESFNSALRAASGVSRGEYLNVSAEEASRRVWETRGSFGFGGVSYYSRGHGLGFYLDMAIRAATDGKQSLDDVMRRLYGESKKEGYSEGRIRELCVAVGGPSLGPIYDQAVKQATPLDFTPFFQHFGVQMSENGATNLGRLEWPQSPRSSR